MIRRCLSLTLCSSLLAWSAAATAKDLSVEKTDRGVTVKIDGQLFTEYLTRSGAKPVLWPLLGPTGKPITSTEEPDHPHQRSLWFTHGDVNGIDFWGEKLGHGTTEHREYLKVAGGEQAVIETRNDWIGPKGDKQCEDVRRLTFRANDDSRCIDFDITLKAAPGDVTFGETKEGSFGMRVAPSMTVKKDGSGGRIVNSEGLVNEDAWGKSCPWVDYHGPVDGKTVGIAIFNHPTSFRYPTYWHVRPYGLFAANPFGVKEFTKSGDGTYKLAAGQTMTLRYRVLLHNGDEKEGHVAKAFAAYKDETK